MDGGGLQKLITVLGRFDTYKRRVRIKLIIYQICIKTMSVKGGVYAHEAYEAKKLKYFLLFEYMGPTSFLYIYVYTTNIIDTMTRCTGEAASAGEPGGSKSRKPQQRRRLHPRFGPQTVSVERQRLKHV